MSNLPLSDSNLAVHNDSQGEGENPPRRNPSMPELQSVSNSDLSDTSSPRPSIIHDDGDADWQDEDTPSLPTGSRRSRAGNDSGDADRDRRHPSQRSGSHSTRLSGSHRTRPNPLYHPYATQSPQNLPRPNRNPPSGGLPPPPHPFPTGANFLANVFRGPQPIGFAAGLNTGDLDGDRLAPLDFNTIMAIFGGGLAPQPEQPDPQRARRMVQALEVVSESLLRRLQHLQEMGYTEEGDCMCAVCWESLLSVGGGFEENQSESVTQMDIVDAPSAPASHPAGSSSAANPEDDMSTLPQVVMLPCGHTFHSACLLPWFSRPQGTTCPTCRFELDPDGLINTRRLRNLNIPGRPGAFTQTGQFQTTTGNVQFNITGGTHLPGTIFFGPSRGPATGPPPQATQTANLAGGNSRRSSSRTNPHGIRGLAQQLDGNAARARSAATNIHVPIPSATAPRASGSGPTASASRSTPQTLNPAPIGLMNPSNPFPVELLGGFLNSLTGNNSQNHDNNRNNIGQPREATHSQNGHDEPPPLEPISGPSSGGPTDPRWNVPTSNDQDIEMEAYVGDDEIEDVTLTPLPWLPDAPPSREMQEELMREMARAYASRMAELVFLEQHEYRAHTHTRNQQAHSQARHPGDTGHHHRHHHHSHGHPPAMGHHTVGGAFPGWVAVPAWNPQPPTNAAHAPSNPAGNGVEGTHQPVLGVGTGLGGPNQPRVIDGGMELIFDGLDPQGNPIARMHFHVSNPPLDNNSRPSPRPPSPAAPNTPAQESTSTMPARPSAAGQTRSSPAHHNPPSGPAQIPVPGLPNIMDHIQGALAAFLRGAGLNLEPDNPGGEVPDGNVPQDDRLPQPVDHPIFNATPRGDEDPAHQRTGRTASWQPPSRTGPSFLEKVEQKERAAGLRCWEPSCEVGPSDDIPVPTTDGRKIPQIRIKKALQPGALASSSEEGSAKGKEKESDSCMSPAREFACEHTFHPGCLVSATRVALSCHGGEVEPERDSETGDTHVMCPVCRTSGVVFGTEWDDGVAAAASLLD